MFNWLFPKKYYFVIRYTYGGMEHETVLRAKNHYDAMNRFYKKHDSDDHHIYDCFWQHI